MEEFFVKADRIRTLLDRLERLSDPNPRPVHGREQEAAHRREIIERNNKGLTKFTEIQEAISEIRGLLEAGE